jgi:hypothetical protein
LADAQRPHRVDDLPVVDELRKEDDKDQKQDDADDDDLADRLLSVLPLLLG